MVDARPPSWERPRPRGRLLIVYVVETPPPHAPGYAPKAVQARFVTDLGHWGHPQKPLVLQQVIGPPESLCGDLRFYPGRDEIRALFETAWKHYDTPAFEFRGDLVCKRRRLGHSPHPVITIFEGLRMEDLDIESWGPHSEPEETRLAPPPDRGPTAEEVLDEAVRRAKAAGRS